MLKHLFIQYLFNIFVDELWIKFTFNLKYSAHFQGLNIFKFDINEIKKNTSSGCGGVFRNFRGSAVPIFYTKRKLQIQSC